MKQLHKMVVSKEKAARAFQKVLDCKKSLMERMKRSYSKEEDPLGAKSHDELKRTMESCRACLKIFWEQRSASSKFPLFAEPYRWSDDDYLAGIGKDGGETAVQPDLTSFELLAGLTAPWQEAQSKTRPSICYFTYDCRADHTLLPQLVRVLHPEAMQSLLRHMEGGEIFSLLIRINLCGAPPCMNEMGGKTISSDHKSQLIEKVAEALISLPLSSSIVFDSRIKEVLSVLKYGGKEAQRVADMIRRFIADSCRKLVGLEREVSQS